MSTVERTSAPALEAGQRLERVEFHARYEAMPPGTNAELVGGVVVMPSPVGNRHGIVDACAMFWLGLYKIRTPGVEASHNATTMLDDENEVQPDAGSESNPIMVARAAILASMSADARS